MFVAFMPLHILLCDEVLPYFVLRVEVVHSLNLNLSQNGLNLRKISKPESLTRSGLRDKAQPDLGEGFCPILS
jgi:hypothetical protein